MKEFLTSLGLSEDAESRLLALTPKTYFGYASELATGEALKN